MCSSDLADPELLAARARLLGLPLRLQRFDPQRPVQPRAAGSLSILPVPLAEKVRCGSLDERNAAYVLATLRAAVQGCLKGRFAALVTGPVHKGVINQSAVSFTGHTEFLAAQTGTSQVVMMLQTEGLRVALATTHLPLKAVSDALTPPHLEGVLRILHRELSARFAISNPHILVCGLNPHAGEQGHLGDEEIKVITPVLEKLRGEGMVLRGPLPADTLFTPQNLQRCDAVLAMFHDQGLPVLKQMGFGRAINVTLGLPIIRTSVDHGTALELAGKGSASAGSLKLAIETATWIANRMNG